MCRAVFVLPCNVLRVCVPRPAAGLGGVCRTHAAAGFTLLHQPALHHRSPTHAAHRSDLNNTKLTGTLPPEWGIIDAMPALDAL